MSFFSLSATDRKYHQKVENHSFAYARYHWRRIFHPHSCNSLKLKVACCTLPTCIPTYIYVYRHVAKHKLIGHDGVVITSALLTMLMTSFAVLAAFLVRWILKERGNIFRLADLLMRHFKCCTQSQSTVGNKHRRLFLIVVILSVTTIILKTSGWLFGMGRCASLRTLRDHSGKKKVILCADGVSYREHFPSNLIVSKTVGRFMGDTFLFHDEETIAHLDWRYEVLETDQCQSILRRNNSLLDQHAFHEKYNQTLTLAEAIGPSPTEGGPTSQTKPERDSSLLAPFRISNELAKPDAMQQTQQVTDMLGECNFDHSSHILLESFADGSSTASSDRSIQLSKSGYGDVVAIVLSGFNSQEKNPYHVMHMDSGLYCLFVALQNAADSASSTTEEKLSVILPISWSSSIGNSIAAALATNFDAQLLVFDQNYTYIKQQRYSSLVHVHGPHFGDSFDIFRSGSMGYNWPLWDSFKFEQHRLPSSFGMAYAGAVRSGVLKQQPQKTRNVWAADDYVLLVQRRNSRRLVGSGGSLLEIVVEMCNLDIPVRLVELETLTADEQIRLVSASTVMVAAHGAGLSHATWMQPGSGVVEVLMRQGFAGTDYHKSDFANLARFFGKKYVYYDALSLDAGAFGINANTVAVDAKELAQVVLCLYQKVRGSV